MQIDELQKNWDEFGKRDALWAILTVPGKQGNKWELDEFFTTGQHEIDELVAFVSSLGIALQPGKALDFGCGVGRLTQALRAHFDSVIGVDIAPSMLELARQHNRSGESVQYVLNESDDLRVFPADTFALIYSNYVLQHMRSDYSLRYIQEFVRVLQPRGTAVFQLPCAKIVPIKERVKAALPTPMVQTYRRMRHGTRAAGPVMETHAVPRERVERAITSSGGRLVHVRENPLHDKRWRSLLYYVTKDA